jgi:hypothetical protein
MEFEIGVWKWGYVPEVLIIFEAKHVYHSVSLLVLVMSRINIDTQKFYMKVIIILPLSELYIQRFQI